MGTDTHARQRNRRGLANPPPGRDADTTTHALQAGRQGATPRRSTHAKETGQRGEGRDEHRSGSDSDR